MRLFVDTNIILEFIEQRREYANVRRILANVRDGLYDGIVSQGSVYTLTFLIERSLKAIDIHKPEQTVQLRHLLKSVLNLFEPFGIKRAAMLEAIENEAFTDIEDSFQYQCALASNCDVLLTININDYKNADQRQIEILTPAQFVEKYLNQEVASQ